MSERHSVTSCQEGQGGKKGLRSGPGESAAFAQEVVGGLKKTAASSQAKGKSRGEKGYVTDQTQRDSTPAAIGGARRKEKKAPPTQQKDKNVLTSTFH